MGKKMNYDDSDFITNISHGVSNQVLKKLKDAAEYFIDDPECQSKCVMMQHLIVSTLMADYLSVMQEMSPLSSEELCAMLVEDAIKLKGANER